MKNLGFTLVEMIVVIAIVGLLVAAAVVAINPTKMRMNARNTQRRVDISTIADAVYQYTVDNNGTLPATITNTATGICKTGTAAATCTSAGLIDLSVLTAAQKYLISIPIDPKATATSTNVGYNISKNSYGRITVAAPLGESATITITK